MAEDTLKKVRFDNDFTDFERHLVTFESVPSVSGGLVPSIHTSGMLVKQKFNELSLSLITDNYGRDVVGDAINSSYAQDRGAHFGTFEGNYSPTNIFQMAENFQNESLADEGEMDCYCAIIGIAFEQDAVPRMKAEKNTPENQGLSFGLQLDFEKPIDAKRFEDIAKLFESHALGVEFTVVGNNSVRAVNFRGEDGLPFAMSDLDFVGKVIKVAEKFPSDEVVEVKRMRVSGNYIANDWRQHPNGEGYESVLIDNGRDDLVSLARDLRTKFLGVTKDFAVENKWAEKTKERQTMDDANGLSIA